MNSDELIEVKAKCKDWVKILFIIKTNADYYIYWIVNYVLCVFFYYVYSSVRYLCSYNDILHAHSASY